ncbi:MobA-like NTP transferase domain protein [Leptospira yanagawae serovar Saopaulo str. Sao Paulo = ATCC 700523]|uniref:MobA-like NTP transferase domain protein n=1 Tax=Leptospira yanagawae serovar Saopaulo str. Sao Paulo = ATCC 700523 TaxID=1249483 RepID=A0A5E8HCL0_9LEPT|nr:nucleotidyltransferase family protein [Leptospira yanagawae]EOQ88954.1 MobA-like NTP transferase domain protein [Leptospira yanagawae serovar Saopaulo str. Sao Paulo = ATCC 700523]
MNAFVLAAGFGKRMGSLTENTPKPLLKIQSITLLDYALYLLHVWNIQNIWVNTHYLGEKILNHLKKFSGISLVVSHESNEILGTAGGIRTALPEDHYTEPILIINPDTLFFPSADFSPKDRLANNSKIHLYLLPIPEGQSYTKISISDDQTLKFGEGNFYYIGLAVLDPKCLLHLEKNRYYDLSDIFKECGKKGEITGELFQGKVLDLGTKELWESYQTKDVFGNKLTKIQNFLSRFNMT